MVDVIDFQRGNAADFFAADGMEDITGFTEVNAVRMCVRKWHTYAYAYADGCTCKIYISLLFIQFIQ